MAFERIQVLIESLLDSSGFRKASDRIQALQGRFNSLNSLFSKARGINRQMDQVGSMREKLDDAGIQMEKLGDGAVAFKDSAGNFLTGSQAAEKLADSMRESGLAAKGLSSQVGNTLNPAMTQVKESTTPATRQLGMFDRASAAVRGRVASVQQTLKGYRRRISKSSAATQGFRFEFLSLMFGAMSLKRVLSGLLKPSMKAAGVFDIWGNTLKILFLPAAFFVLDIVQSISSFLLGLPSIVQKGINVFVLLVFALTSVALVAFLAELSLQGLVIAIANGTGSSIVLSGASWLLSASLSAVAGAASLAWGAITSLAGIVGTIIGLLSLKVILLGALAVGIGLLLNWVIEAVTGFDALGFALEWVQGALKGVWDWIKDLVPQIKTVTDALGGFIDTAKEAIGLGGDGESPAGSGGGGRTSGGGGGGFLSGIGPSGPGNLPDGMQGVGSGTNIGQQVNNIEVKGADRPEETARRVNERLNSEGRRRI